MKNRRALLFSIVSGFVAVMLAWYYISTIEKRLRADYEEITVVVATRDIARYERIDESALTLKSIPKPFVQPMAYEKERVIELIGGVANTTIKKGEQVVETKVAKAGELKVSNDVPHDMRACTIAVDEVTGVGGLIYPGDNVDIIGVFKTVDAKSRVATEAESVTLFQNVPILAVGRNYSYTPSLGPEANKKAIDIDTRVANFSNVTVTLKPRQCQELAVVQQVGVITLTLRSNSNRIGGDSFPDLKEKRSTAGGVSGIQAPLEISHRPKWLETRGDQSVFAP